MSRSRRKYLLYIATFQAAFAMLFFSYSFWYLTDMPPEKKVIIYPVSLVIAVAWSLPLWMPAVVPVRFTLLSRIVRWACAFLQFIYIWQFGVFITHQISRWRGGQEYYISVVALGVTGVLAALVAIVILLWPINSVQPTAARFAASGG
jgi:hypothetical protein